MSKGTLYFTAFAIMSILTACRGSEEISLEVDVSCAEVCRLEDLAAEVKVIPLEIRDTTVKVGDIYSLKSYGDRIFLYDERFRKIQCFDGGRYYGELDRVGRGPEEYIDIGAYTYDAFRDELVIFERNARQLKFYSCSSFRMSRSIQMDFYISALEHISGDKFLVVKENSSRDSNDGAVLILDMVTGCKVDWFPVSTVQSDLISDMFITRKGDGRVLFALPGYVNEVYRADTTGFTEVSGIFFGKYGARRKFWEEESTDGIYIKDMLEGGGPAAIAPSYYMEDGERESFWYVSRYSTDMYHQPLMSLFIRDGEAYRAVSRLVIDGVTDDLQPLCASEGYYFSIVYPQQVSAVQESMSPLCREIAAVSETAGDNPLIIAFRI